MVKIIGGAAGAIAWCSVAPTIETGQRISRRQVGVLIASNDTMSYVLWNDNVFGWSYTSSLEAT